MVDAISKNRKDEAFILLHNLLISGENAYMVLSRIVAQLETMLEVKELKSEGKTLAQMQKILDIHEFRIKKAIGFTDRYTENDLKRILQSAYEVDRNIKTGFFEPKFALEMLIAGI